jgi:hypothetical protein
MVEALKRHARNPSHLRILEGLQALEALNAARQALAPLFGDEQLVIEGKHLAEALRTLLPPTAARVLSSEVEARFRSEVEDRLDTEAASRAMFWYHTIPGVGIWHPVWREVASASEAADPIGAWFVEGYQTVYERWHAKAEAERSREEDAEEKRSQVVEEARRRKEDEDRRSKETRLREEESRRQRHERERHALEEARKRELRERTERERQRRADLEAQREVERAEGKERARRERDSIPQQPRFWKRRSDEIQQRYAQAEWRAWCRSKGLSRDEVPDDVRDRFMRHI